MSYVSCVKLVQVCSVICNFPDSNCRGGGGGGGGGGAAYYYGKHCTMELIWMLESLLKTLRANCHCM